MKKQIFAFSFLIFITLWGSTTSYAWRIEANAITTNNTFNNSSFTSVSFLQPFDITPVVVVLATNQGGDSSMLRIQAVTPSGFQVSAVESPGQDGPHISMDIHYIAMEPGNHVLPTGERVVAGFHNTTTIQRQSNVGGPAGWDTVNFGTTLSSTASVIAMLQTMNSESGSPPVSPSQPLLSVAVRNPSNSSVQLAIERSEVAAGSISSERIGYIAFPSGSNGNFNDMNAVATEWSATTSSDTIVGWDNSCITHTFSTTPFSAARVVATKNSRDGSDGGWLRRCSLSSTTIGLQVDEDIANDSERSHTDEIVGALAFSRSFHAEFEGLISAIKSVSIVDGPLGAPAQLFALPGATARYHVEVSSTGNLPIDNNSVTFIDPIPTNTALVVTDFAAPGSGPVQFTDGSPSSTLTYTFTSLASTTDDLEFSNDGGVTFTYTPSPDSNGTDLAVTHIRISPQGSFAPDNTNFEIDFDVIIQ